MRKEEINNLHNIFLWVIRLMMSLVIAFYDINAIYQLHETTLQTYLSMITNTGSWAYGMQNDNFTCLQLFSKLWPIAKKILAQVSGGGYHIVFYQNITEYDRHCRCSGKWVSMVSDASLSYVARDHVLIAYLLCYLCSSY